VTDLGSSAITYLSLCKIKIRKNQSRILLEPILDPHRQVEPHRPALSNVTYTNRRAYSVYFFFLIIRISVQIHDNVLQ
jgi:hypothetical protein